MGNINRRQVMLGYLRRLATRMGVTHFFKRNKFIYTFYLWLAGSNEPVRNSAQAVHHETEVFLWLNFGSCLLRTAFSKSEFRKESIFGLPLQVSQVWRRDISAVTSDWDVEIQSLGNLRPSAFSQSWLTTPSVFQSADVILVDLGLDITYSISLRFRRPEDVAGIAYDHIVSNFPEEPPAEFLGRIGAFPNNEDSTIAAWKRFGIEISTPTVFITYEHCDDAPAGYEPAFRKRLLDFQSAIEELAKRFPHWLVISMDDIFAGHGLECYRDRHHPSPHGYKIFQEYILENC